MLWVTRCSGGIKLLIVLPLLIAFDQVLDPIETPARWLGGLEAGTDMHPVASSIGPHDPRTVGERKTLTEPESIGLVGPSLQSNLPPAVSAGLDQSTGLFDPVLLTGSAADDNLPDPPGTLTTTWSLLSGSGIVTFTNSGALETSASFSNSGTYMLELTADDGEFTSSDQLTITVMPSSIIRIPQDQSTIQAGVNAAQNWDLVLVSPGTYTENLSLSGKTLTLASQFHTTQDSSLIEQTVIDGGGATVITLDETMGPETKIVGFTIQNGNDGISAASKLYILHNRFTGNGDAVDYEGGGGICRNNLFDDNSDDAIDLDRSTAAVIENNIIRNSGDDGIEIRLHSYSGPTLDIIIRNNVIADSAEDGIQLIDYAGLSDRFFLIEHNLIQDNFMVGLGLMDNGETIEDFRAASIPEPIRLFNNTFTGNDYALTGGDNLIALNNLFIDSTTLGLKGVDGNSIAAYNLFWNNGLDHQGSNISTTTSLFVDPLLDVDLKLQPGSPAIDAGAAHFDHLGEVVLDLPPSAYSGTAPDLGKFESTFSSPANQIPVALDDSYPVNEDTMLNVAAPGVLSNDSDPDGDPLTALLVGTVSSGTLSLQLDGSFVYTPTANVHGNDRFTYRANDGVSDSNLATTTIAISPINDAPVAVDDSAGTNVNSAVNVAVLNNDSDPDGDALSLAALLQPANGVATVNVDDSVTYTPTLEFSGTDVFTYTIGDGNGLTDTALVTVTVSLQPPGQVTQTSPLGSIGESTPTFVWQVEPAATDYTLVVYRVDTKQIVFMNTYPSTTICGASECVVQPTVGELLLPSASYTWLVRASNSAGDGPWSVYTP